MFSAIPNRQPATGSAIEVCLPDPDATTRFAGRLAACLPARLCIWLCGDLGAGKTHFARALLRALGWQGTVRSPTYTLLEPYELRSRQPRRESIGEPPNKLEPESQRVLYHFDLYRMASPEEWADAGFDDLLADAIRLIEWPERGGVLTPPPDLRLELAVAGAGRTARLTAHSPVGEETWRFLAAALRADMDHEEGSR